MQATIALSSGEAEYYGIVKAACVSLGLVGLLKDWGLQYKAEIRTDASAAKSIASRRGVGKVRHLQTRYLWVQEKTSTGELTLQKVSTHLNVADVLTKAVLGPLLDQHVHALGVRFESVPHPTAKKVQEAK